MIDIKEQVFDDIDLDYVKKRLGRYTKNLFVGKASIGGNVVLFNVPEIHLKGNYLISFKKEDYSHALGRLGSPFFEFTYDFDLRDIDKKSPQFQLAYKEIGKFQRGVYKSLPVFLQMSASKGAWGIEVFSDIANQKQLDDSIEFAKKFLESLESFKRRFRGRGTIKLW